jgi:hypothetical protein
MSLNLSREQIANPDNPINMNHASNEDIEVLTMKFRTKPNIGKYIIFTDEHYGGYGQTDEYKGKKIINESGDRNDPFINLSQEYVDVYVIQRPPRGGQSKKKLNSRRRGPKRYSRRRRRSRRQIKKNYK